MTEEKLASLEEQLETLHHAARDFLNFCSEYQPPTTTVSYGARFRALERALGIAAPDPASIAPSESGGGPPVIANGIGDETDSIPASSPKEGA